MRKYKFTVTVVSHVLPSGELFPENCIFKCELWADKKVDRYTFGEQLFAFWNSSNLLVDAQSKWTYDWNIEEL